MPANGFWKYVLLGEKKLNSNQSSLVSCIKGRKSMYVVAEIARRPTIAATEIVATIVLGIKR